MTDAADNRFYRTAEDEKRASDARAAAVLQLLEEFLNAHRRAPASEEWQADRPGCTTSEYRLQVVDRAIGGLAVLVVAVLSYLEKPVDWELLVALAGVVLGNGVAGSAYAKARAAVKEAKMKGEE